MSRTIVQGDKALIRRLQRLSKPSRVRAAARDSLAKGGTVMNKALKASVPESAPGVTRTIGYGETKTTIPDDVFLPAIKKSIGQRSKTYGNVVFRAIGPRYDYRADDPATGRSFSPSAIAKATEFGTNRNRPVPFMRPGFARGVRPALNAITQRLAGAIDKQAAKG